MLVGKQPVNADPAGAAEVHQQQQLHHELVIAQPLGADPQAQVPTVDSSWGASVLSSIRRVLLGRLQMDSSGTLWAPGANAEAATTSTSTPLPHGEAAGNSRVVFSVQGSDVSRHLSAVKSVSAVLDADAHEFHQYILRNLQK